MLIVAECLWIFALNSYGSLCASFRSIFLFSSVVYARYTPSSKRNLASKIIYNKPPRPVNGLGGLSLLWLYNDFFDDVVGRAVGACDLRCQCACAVRVVVAVGGWNNTSAVHEPADTLDVIHIEYYERHLCVFFECPLGVSGIIIKIDERITFFIKSLGGETYFCLFSRGVRFSGIENPHVVGA